jgi:SUMO ligase MMS21 Smc5/6 complex component
MRDNGEKTTMTAMVREAIEKYLTNNENLKKQKFSLMKVADIRYNVRDERVVHSHQLDTRCQKHRVVGAIETKAL